MAEDEYYHLIDILITSFVIERSSYAFLQRQLITAYSNCATACTPAEPIPSLKKEEGSNHLCYVTVTFTKQQVRLYYYFAEEADVLALETSSRQTEEIAIVIDH